MNTNLRALLVLMPLTLAACTASPPETDEVPALDGDATEPRSAQPLPIMPSTPIVYTNLRALPQVNVKWAGTWAVYLVEAGKNINVPCDKTSIELHLIYSNDGNMAAGAHYNKGYFGTALTPFQTKSQPGLAAGAQVTEVFTKSLVGVPAGTPQDVTLVADWPSGVNETNESDNSVKIRVTRVCP